jgi:N-acyl-D-amino-acid deacylase
MKRAFRVACLVLATSLAAGAAQSADPIDADIVLRGGTLHDGTGNAAEAGDVAIRDGRVVAVGRFTTGTVGTELDCKGLVVTPGFIDLHNHSDSQVVDRRTRANVNFLMQGCTTVVTGNCGGGPIDVGAYYDKIDSAGAGTNVIHLLPQGNLRGAVIGNTQRAATPDEIEKMKQLAAKAMQEGAWGMSTGLIYVPSSYANTEELIEIAKVVGEHGGLYASHMRNEGVQILAAVNEALEIGRQGRLPVHISHFKSSGKDSWGLVRRAAEMVEKARTEGMRVTADQYPYIASSTSLEATVIPTWARSGGQKALVARFDGDESSRLREAVSANLERADGGARIRIARYAKRQDWVGKSIAEIAKSENVAPLEIVESITRNGGAAIVNFGMHEEDVRYIMSIPWVATASDGRAYLPGADRPHPRNYGTFPRKVGYYAQKEKVISLEHALRSSNGLPADILGLTDRGYLREGQAADVVVFDPAEILDAATFEAPHQYGRGIRHVFVNGEPAVFNGTPTGALAGKALRHITKKERL